MFSEESTNYEENGSVTLYVYRTISYHLKKLNYQYFLYFFWQV